MGLFDNALGHRQSKARTAIFTTDAVVGLGKLVEDQRQLLGRDSRARIANLKRHPMFAIGAFLAILQHANPAARIGKLDGVREQIRGDLPQSQWIARQGPGSPRRTFEPDLDALLLQLLGGRAA